MKHFKIEFPFQNMLFALTRMSVLNPLLVLQSDIQFYSLLSHCDGSLIREK